MNTYDGVIIPESVAVIMDGNGRWAQRRGLPRTMGHQAGAKAVEKIIPAAGEMGIRYLTVYAFSTENWKRSDDEVNALMDLFRIYGEKLLTAAKANNVRIKMIGDRSRFAQDIIDEINKLERETWDNTGLTFIMAANYGGRDEIRRAAMAFAKDVASGKIEAEGLTEDGFSAYLDTAGLPDPDVIIRTSGEIRTSNFLVWQGAYSEFVATDVLWPDFTKEELLNCLREFNKRSRRFGGVK